MHCVDVVKSYKSGYEGHPLFKLCECWVGCWDFFSDVYVGAQLLYCMGRTFQGQSSILVEEMFMWWKEFGQITYLDVIK